MPDDAYRPSADDPLLIMAMDHRESFGRSLFGVTGDQPDHDQLAAMEAAKQLIYAGLAAARGDLPGGRAGVLVDERYGRPVVQAARSDGVVLAVPVERSGRDWFELEWGPRWPEHVAACRPDYAKLLVRDNPAFPAGQRDRQLRALRDVSDELRSLGVPLLYELLVPATADQLRAVGSYDRDLRPDLVRQVIASNQEAGVEPAIWKVEGLETAAAAGEIVTQIRAGGRDEVCAIVLGRDAPAQRLDHWLQVAAPIDGFVGFAIGRSIWEEPISNHNQGKATADQTVSEIAARYLGFARRYWAAR